MIISNQAQIELKSDNENIILFRNGLHAGPKSVLVQKGIVNKEKFYIPLEQTDRQLASCCTLFWWQRTDRNYIGCISYQERCKCRSGYQEITKDTQRVYSVKGSREDCIYL